MYPRKRPSPPLLAFCSLVAGSVICALSYAWRVPLRERTMTRQRQAASLPRTEPAVLGLVGRRWPPLASVPGPSVPPLPTVPSCWRLQTTSYSARLSRGRAKLSCDFQACGSGPDGRSRGVEPLSALTPHNRRPGLILAFMVPPVGADLMALNQILCCSNSRWPRGFKGSSPVRRNSSVTAPCISVFFMTMRSARGTGQSLWFAATAAGRCSPASPAPASPARRLC